MLNYNKRNTIILSLIVSIIVYVVINYIVIDFNERNKNNKETQKVSMTKINLNQENKKDLIEENKDNTECIVDCQSNEQTNDIKILDTNLNKYTQYKWRIQIPKIKLNAPIVEGTQIENMRKGVAHFESSSNWDGNVCLAAHNRGYKYNYFQEIKQLEIGDKIIYKTEEGIRNYEVELNEIIKQTDWLYLKQTNENKITLITCVENNPEYRVCIQAKEI